MPPSQSGLSVRDIAAMIDHTLLKPQATDADIRRLCQEARQYQFVAVCVNPYWVPLVRTELQGSPVKVCSVIGFPLGATSTEAKVAESAAAFEAVWAHLVSTECTTLAKAS